MAHKHVGGCAHVRSWSDHDPIDNHTCHCSVCKRVAGQPTTDVVFFNHGDLHATSAHNRNRQPFNSENPDGPLEMCTCKACGAPIMLDDRQHRIREIVPNLMGTGRTDRRQAITPSSTPGPGCPGRKTAAPSMRAVHAGLCPDFTWPAAS